MLERLCCSHKLFNICMQWIQRCTFGLINLCHMLTDSWAPGPRSCLQGCPLLLKLIKSYSQLFRKMKQSQFSWGTICLGHHVREFVSFFILVLPSTFVWKSFPASLTAEEIQAQWNFLQQNIINLSFWYN